MSKPIAYLTAGMAALLLMVTLLPMPILAGTSNTRIEPGQTFILGGEQGAGLAVKATNSGQVPVEILLQKSDQQRSITTLEPGASTDLKVPARNAALFRNTSKNTAVLNFKLNRSVTSLSMRYDRD